jgi:S-methylmethionine-dependent homocysteine/selenocysteine methylase
MGPIVNSPSILLLDGATGTELGRRGADISLPLWSARAMLDAPDTLAQVHRDYLQAGADIITANTFRTHRRSLAKVGMAERCVELTQRAVQIAIAARDDLNPHARVFGSVAPLEDCYTPELAPDFHTCESEHAEMITHVLDAGVDGVLIETMNCLREASAAARQAQRLAPGRWILSLCMCSDGPPGVLLSGESATDLIPLLNHALAFGVNCVAAPAIEAQVKLFRHLAATTVRISAYANIGFRDESGDWVCTDAVDPDAYADYAARWIVAGASIIGGCCGTRPETIKAIASRLGRTGN